MRKRITLNLPFFNLLSTVPTKAARGVLTSRSDLCPVPTFTCPSRENLPNIWASVTFSKTSHCLSRRKFSRLTKSVTSASHLKPPEEKSWT